VYKAFVSILLIGLLQSCRNPKNKTDISEDKKLIWVSDTIEKKFYTNSDTLKKAYVDSVAYAIDQHFKTSDSLVKIEKIIIDTIVKLKEVIDRAKYVQQQTKGKRHLLYTLWQKPTAELPYYWVKVLEDNGTNVHTHFDFYVRNMPFQILYYDAVKDTAIELATWRKQKLSGNIHQ
jgi:hypothetical protein